MNRPAGETRRHGGRKRLAFIAGATLVGTILIALEQGWSPPPGEGLEEGRNLTRPLRLEVASPGAFREFLLGLRVHHYRPQSQGEATYQDIFFDTSDRVLSRHGYSFRFRTKIQGGERGQYSIRLARESQRAPGESKRLDLVSDLPDGLGEAIAAGAWPLAVAGGPNQAATERVRAVLHGLGIEAESLEPQLVGELRRERFDITDKGQSWFTVDHESWVFRLFRGTEGTGVVRCEDIVLDTTLSRDNLELLRRVRTMEQLTRMVYGIRPTTRAPHERAIEALAAERTGGTVIPLR